MLFGWIGGVAQSLRQPVWYQFHAVDFLSMSDALDPRIACHPGMQMPLERKLELQLKQFGLSAGPAR